MRLAVRMTRHAISPRLAINNLWKRRASDTITSFLLHALICLEFFAQTASYPQHYARLPTALCQALRTRTLWHGCWCVPFSGLLSVVFRLADRPAASLERHGAI